MAEHSDIAWSQQSDEDFVQSALDEFRTAKTESKDWREEAREDYDFYSGDQWSSDDKTLLDDQGRPVVTFNRAAPTIDAVSGVERSNRQEVQFIPRTVQPAPDQIDDAGVSEMFTSAARWIRDEGDSEDEESHAFQDAVICGMGWTDTFVDYEEDMDGKIHSGIRFSPLEAYWDATASKPNLTDTRWRGRLRMMRNEDIRQAWPDAEIIESKDLMAELFVDEDRQETGELLQRYKNHVPVFQFQWWERMPVVRFVRPDTRKITVLPEEAFAQLQEQLEGKGFEPLQGVRQFQRQYFQAFIGGSTLLERGPLHPNPGGLVIPDFTLQVITGKLNERERSFFGLMRQMKDPQRWSNKFLSQTMHIFNSGAKGGLLAEKAAFENPQKAEEDWAKAEAIVWMADGALSAQKPRVQERAPPQMPPALDNLLAFAVGSIREVVGVNLEFLGLRGKFQAGVVEESRIRQGMLVLSAFFDGLRRYRKRQGRVLMHFIQTYIEEGRLIRITGSNKFVQFARDPTVARYDVIVDQAPASANQKAEIWGGLQQIIPAMMKAGIGIPPDVIDYAPLPASVIARMKAFFKQQGETQAARAELAKRREESEIAETQAGALLDLSKAEAATDRAATDAQNAQTKAFEAIAGALIDAAEAAKPEASTKQ